MSDPWSKYRAPGQRPVSTAGDGTYTSAATDFYDDLAKQAVNRERLERQRQAVQTYSPQPDQRAQARQLERKLGVPAPAIETDIPGYKAQAEREDTALAAGDPRLGSWLADNADIAGDDIQSLLFMRDASDKMASRLDDLTSTRGALRRLGLPTTRAEMIDQTFRPEELTREERTALRQSTANREDYRSAVSSAVIAKNRMSDEEWAAREDAYLAKQRMQRGTWGQIAGSLRAGTALAGGGIWGTAAAIMGAAGWDSGEQFALDVQGATEDYAAENRGRSTSFVIDSLYGGVESVPTSVAALMTGSTRAAAGLFFTTTGGQSYAEGRREGMGVGSSIAYGGLNGGIEVATEYLPTGRLIDLAKGKSGVGNAVKRFLIGEAAGEQAATALQDFTSWAMLPSNADKPFSEYLAERPEAAARTFFATVSGAGPQVAAAYGLQLAFRKEAQLETSQDAQSALDELVDGATNAKTRTRDPGAFRSLMDRLTGGARNIYISAEAIRSLNQDYSEDPFWGDYKDEIGRALASGGDVAIPLSDVTARLAGTDQWNAIRSDVRANPGGYTPKEIEEANAALETARFEAGEELDAQERQARREAAPSELLRQSIRDRLMNAGMSPDQAATNAEVTAALFETEAANLGRQITGREFDQAVRVIRQLPEMLGPAAPAEQLDLIINAMRRGGDAEIGVGPSLLQFIRARGGINNLSKDLKDLPPGLNRQFDPGQGGFAGISGQGDYGYDTTLRAAIEAGYFPELGQLENEAGPSQLDTNVLLDAISREISGEKFYSETRVDTVREAADQLREILSSAGLDPNTATDAQIREAIDQYERVGDRSLEQLPATLEIDGVARSTTNSDGQQIAPDEAGVRAFWAWFGDSKVVDDQGRPKVMYHGTLAEQFDAFDMDRAVDGAHFFTDNTEHAAFFAGFGGGRSGGRVMSFYVAINDPLAVTQEQLEDALPQEDADAGVRPMDQMGDFVDRARQAGNDGVIAEDFADIDQENYVALPLTPEQIKSTDNVGTFDPRDARYLRQGAAEERSEAFRRWAGTDASVIEPEDINDFDFSGEGPFVLKAYHGTTHDFEAFDASIRGNKEGQFGAVNYFTSNEADASDNYGAEGPDLTQRIEQRAERIEQDEEIDMEEARARAREEIAGEQQRTLEVFIRTEKPFVVGGDNNPWIEFVDFEKLDRDAMQRVAEEEGVDVAEIEASRDDYQEAIDEARWDIEADTPNRLVEAIERVAERYPDMDAQKLLADLSDATVEEVQHSALEQALRNSEALAYVEDYDNGGLIGYHVLGEVIQELGFDSIILKNAEQRFGTMNIEPGTAHVHVFDANRTNIKSVDNLGSFNPADPRILYQSDVFYSELQRAASAAQTARAPAEQWKATLAKAPGVKAEEIEWSGLNEWLDAQHGPVERADLVAFLENGGVVVEEKVLGRFEEGDEADLLGELYQVAEDEETGEWVVWDKDFLREYGRFDDDEAAFEEASLLEQSDIADIREQERGTQFKDWSSDPESDSYRELLITLPVGRGNNPPSAPQTHWSEPAVVAHARFMDKVDVEGRRVLFVEEVQSDWHQKGRDQGYSARPTEDGMRAAETAKFKADEAFVDAVRALDTVLATTEGFEVDDRFIDTVYGASAKYPDLYSAAYAGEGTPPDAVRDAAEAAKAAKLDRDLRGREYDIAIGALRTGIPDAPFKSTWPALVMKRMIAWAAENGYDRVAWANGEQQAERYDLSARIGEIEIERVVFDGDAQYDITLDTSEAQNALIGQAGAGPYTVDQVREILGTDLGTRAIEAADKRSEGRPEADAKARSLFDAMQEQGREGGLDDPANRERYDAWSSAALEAKTKTGPAVMSGEDLKIGGEGMKAFYDRNLVNITNKIIKRHGAKVEPIEIADRNNPAAVWKRRLVDAEERIAQIEALSPDAQRQLKELATGDITTTLRPFRLREDELRQRYNALVAERRAEEEARGRALWEESNRAADPAERTRLRTEARAIMEGRARDDQVDPALFEEYDAARQARMQREELVNRALYLNGAYAAREEAQAAIDDLGEPVVNAGFDITPELRAAAKEGFALFQGPKGKTPRGQVTGGLISGDVGPTIIKLFEGSDFSTFQHEMAHFWLERFKGNATAAVEGDGNPAARQTFADWETLKGWFKENGHPVAADGTIPTEAHELFARGWERYLMEGKAPTPRLQSVFRKFARWLKSIYRTVKGLNAPITADVRQVMERMLATEEQIALALEERNARLLFDDAVEAGMSEDDARRYAELGEEVRNEAEEELYGKVMRSIRNRETREYRKVEAVIREEVTASIDNRPVFKALGMLRSPEGPRLDRRWLVDTYGEDSTALLPAGMPVYRDGGDNAEQIAELAGFSSADEMVRALMGIEQARKALKASGDKRSLRKATIEQEVAQEMAERYGDPLGDGTIEREASAAIQNERQGERLALELKALAAKTRRKPTPYAMARQWAKERIANSVVSEAISGAAQHRYTRTAAKAARDAQEAFLRGDNEEAFRHKQTEMLHNALAREAAIAADEVDVIVRRMSNYAKQSKATSMPLDYLERIQVLLEGFEFRKVSQRGLDRRAALKAWIAEQEAEGRSIELPAYLLDQVELKNWSRMSVDELKTLNDAVQQIAALGRMKGKLLTAKRIRELEDAAAKIEEAIRSSKRGPKKDVRTRETLGYRASRAFKSFKAMHRKMASLAREMDSVTDGGPVWELLIRPMMERFDFEATENKVATERLMDILGPFYGRTKTGMPKMGGKGIYFPHLDRSFNLEERMAIVGQMGNAGNMQRLIDGERGEFGIQWSREKLQPIVDSLTREQMDAVQAIWDLFDSYRPRIAEKERRVSGREPEWIDPVPLETRHGTYRGGYWPIKYDPNRTLAAQQADDAKEAERQMQGAFTAATTQRSFTKSRAEKVVGRPLLYSLSSVTQGLTDVVHDLAFHEYLIDANRLLRHPKVSSAMINYYGPEVLEQFRRGIEDVAAGSVGAQNVFEKGVNHVRMGATVAGLGWNLKTALLQPFGITQSIVRVGAPWIARGARDWFAHPVSVAQEIYGKSEFMRNRADTMQREINEIRNRIRGGTKAGEFMNASFFLLITRTQLAVDIPTWKGAYEKAIAQGNAEDDAVQMANQAVRDAQGGGQIGDLSAIQRGGPLQKLFTNFYSFFNTTYNLTAESYARTDFRKPGDVMALALDYLLLYSLPAAMGTFLQIAFSGDDDDDDSLLAMLASEQLSFLAGTMVGLREVSGGIQSLVGAATGTDLRPYDAAYGGPAGLRGLQEIDRFSQQVEQGEFDRAMRKSAVNAAGILLHLPSGQINKTWDGVAALNDGETKNPAVLVTGR